MEVKGFGWDKSNNTIANTESPIKVPQSFSDAQASNRCGMPITLEAFLQMQLKFFQAVMRGEFVVGNAYAFDVSKASLFRLLSQEGCEMLTFYFVIPDNNEELSLAIAGKDINMQLLKKDIIEQAATEIASGEAVSTTNTGTEPLKEEKVGKSRGGLDIRSLKDALVNKEWAADFSEPQKFVDFVKNNL